MKLTTLMITLFFMFSCASQASDNAINTVKKNEKIKQFLSDKSPKNYWIKYHEMELGGMCGIAGCNWRKLVSLVVTSKRANAPSVTIMALVQGQEPDRGSKPTIRFVDFKDMDPSIWENKL